MKFFGNGGQISEEIMVQSSWRATVILHSIQHLLKVNSNLVGIQSEQWEQSEDEGTTLK